MVDFSIGHTNANFSYYHDGTNIRQLASPLTMGQPEGGVFQFMDLRVNSYHYSTTFRMCLWRGSDGALMAYSGTYNPKVTSGTANNIDWISRSDFNTYPCFWNGYAYWAGASVNQGYFIMALDGAGGYHVQGNTTQLAAFTGYSDIDGGYGGLCINTWWNRAGGVKVADGTGTFYKYKVRVATRDNPGGGDWVWRPVRWTPDGGTWRRVARGPVATPMALEPPPPPSVDFHKRPTIWYPGKTFERLGER